MSGRFDIPLEFNVKCIQPLHQGSLGAATGLKVVGVSRCKSVVIQRLGGWACVADMITRAQHILFNSTSINRCENIFIRGPCLQIT